MIANWLRSLKVYLGGPAARTADDLGDAIEREIAFHLAERQAEYVDRGMSIDEAEQAAVTRFGNPSRIAEECHAASTGGLALWHRAHLTMTILLATTVIALVYEACVRDRAGEFLSQLPPGIATMLDDDWTGDLSGRIRDGNGNPIGNAHVLAVVKAWPDGSYFQRAYSAMTNAAGDFLIENIHPVDARYAVQIAVVADERVLKSTYITRDGGTLDPVCFDLPASTGFALVVESAEGSGVADAEILLQSRIESDGTEHSLYFDSAQAIVRHTDSQGRIQLPHFLPGETACFLLRTAGGDWQPHEVVVPHDGDFARIRTLLTVPPNHQKES